MVDYKKKYLKYKKKYLAIKKLKGGSDWFSSVLWRDLVYETGKAAATVGEGAKGAISSTVKYATAPVLPTFAPELVPESEPDRESKYLGNANGKIFRIFKSNAPTQFNARMAYCEDTMHDLLAIGSLGKMGEHDLDRFLLINKENIENLLPQLYYPEPGGAEIIKYINGKNANIEENIYSDHEAICMPLYTGIPNNYKKLITMNLEGFCWPNGENFTEKNQQRLDNVLDLLNPYILPVKDGPPISRGNIFLFQEVVLKDAANFDEEEKKSLIHFRDALSSKNPYYVLVHDGCTGAILYDRREWNLEEIINIDRRFVDYNNEVKGPGDAIKKKSNGYRFKNQNKNENEEDYEMCVVNIHLKAMMKIKEFSQAGLESTEADENQRLFEIANIYNIMKNHSGISDFEIPVYFGGDWNSQWAGGLFPCYTNVEHLEEIETNQVKINSRLYPAGEYAEIQDIILPPPPLPPTPEETAEVTEVTEDAEEDAEKDNLFISAMEEPPAETVPNNILDIIDMEGFRQQPDPPK